MISYLADKIVKYPRFFLSCGVGFGTLGFYNGWKVTKYDPNGRPELYTDRVLVSLLNGAIYATPFTWPLNTFCLLRKGEIHITQLDKSQYHWLYSEYLGLGRHYAEKYLSKNTSQLNL